MPPTPPRTAHPAPGDLPFVVHEWFGGSGDPWFFALVRLRGAAPNARDLRELVRDRWGSVPRLRLRAGAVLPGRRRGRPRWFVSDDFEPDRYVVAAPVAPGPNALRERVGELLAERIPPTRASWRLYLLSGHEPDGFAVLLRMHHAVADGVTVIRLLERLMGAGSDAAAGSAGPGPAVRRVPPGRASLRGLAATVGGVLGRNSRLPFNGRIGTGRHVTWVRVSPETVRAARRAAPGSGRPTVNDVYLAAVAGALRAVAPAGPAPPRRVAALVPVNMRTTGEAARIGNVVSFFRVPLPLAERDPGVRLARVHAATTRAKATGQAAIARAAIEVSARLPLRVGRLAGLVTMSAGYANTSCTNIPGPDVPLVLLGRPAVELVVAPPLMGAQGVVFGFTGLGDAFTVCVTADRAHGATADRLAEAIRVEFEEPARIAAR
ncbi:WS/DGAT domain-containing protein [Embleya sp. NPDC001921]